MTIIPQFIYAFLLESLAIVPHLCHQNKRATNALATHQWPSTETAYQERFMPLIPITALIVFLQGRRA